MNAVCPKYMLYLFLDYSATDYIDILFIKLSAESPSYWWWILIFYRSAMYILYIAEVWLLWFKKKKNLTYLWMTPTYRESVLYEYNFILAWGKWNKALGIDWVVCQTSRRRLPLLYLIFCLPSGKIYCHW